MTDPIHDDHATEHQAITDPSLQEPTEAPVPDKTSLGAYLAQARIAQNLTEEDMVHYLKWTLPRVKMVENDAYETPHNVSFIRAMVRSYAKALKLDETVILAQLDQTFADHQRVANLTIAQDPAKSVAHAERCSKKWMMVLGLVMAVAALFYYLQAQSQSVTPSASSSVMPTEASSDPAAEPSPLILDGAEQPQATAESSDAPTASAMGERLLSLTVQTDAWVSVTDDEKKQTLFNELLSTNQPLALKVHLPVRLTIGNATQARLLVDGTVIDLSPYSKGGVARFELTEALLTAP